SHPIELSVILKTSIMRTISIIMPLVGGALFLLNTVPFAPRVGEEAVEPQCSLRYLEWLVIPPAGRAGPSAALANAVRWRMVGLAGHPNARQASEKIRGLQGGFAR